MNEAALPDIFSLLYQAPAFPVFRNVGFSHCLPPPDKTSGSIDVLNANAFRRNCEDTEACRGNIADDELKRAPRSTCC